MTFSIKHIPNGITPYNEDRYERKPQYPTEEDEIIIKCVAVNCDDSTQIKLYLKINGMEKVFYPEKKMDLEKSEMNCEFEIGKIKFSDKVSYYFEGQCHNERTRTKEYIDQITDKSIRILIPGCGNAHEAEYLFRLG